MGHLMILFRPCFKFRDKHVVAYMELEKITNGEIHNLRYHSKLIESSRIGNFPLFQVLKNYHFAIRNSEKEE